MVSLSYEIHVLKPWPQQFNYVSMCLEMAYTATVSPTAQLTGVVNWN